METPKGTPKKAKETKETKDHAKDQLISRTRKQQGSVVAWGYTWGPVHLKRRRGGAESSGGTRQLVDEIFDTSIPASQNGSNN